VYSLGICRVQRLLTAWFCNPEFHVFPSESRSQKNHTVGLLQEFTFGRTQIREYSGKGSGLY
jgi:hypothetical protein